jgi:hypothetical protein
MYTFFLCFHNQLHGIRHIRTRTTIVKTNANKVVFAGGRKTTVTTVMTKANIKKKKREENDPNKPKDPLSAASSLRWRYVLNERLQMKMCDKEQWVNYGQNAKGGGRRQFESLAVDDSKRYYRERWQLTT